MIIDAITYDFNNGFVVAFLRESGGWAVLVRVPDYSFRWDPSPRWTPSQERARRFARMARNQAKQEDKAKREQEANR